MSQRERERKRGVGLREAREGVRGQEAGRQGSREGKRQERKDAGREHDKRCESDSRLRDQSALTASGMRGERGRERGRVRKAAASVGVEARIKRMGAEGGRRRGDKK